MSAALVILPVIWATEEMYEVGSAYVPEDAQVVEQPLPGLAFYRKYTEGLLRRYVRLAMEAGRAPSLLGREMFRGKVTNYKVHGFDDVVIFVHDVERCLETLDDEQQFLIDRIALQEYTYAEAVELLGVPLRTLIRRYANTLDVLTELFLERKLLEPLKSCQGG